MKRIIIMLLLVTSLNGFTQESTGTVSEKSNLSLGADIQSRYIWRGIKLGGNSASLQPYIEYSVGKLAFGGWGAYSLGGDIAGQEVDLYITFSATETLSFTFTDYFFPDGNNNYFNYGSETGHVFEVMASFSGTKTFPIGLTIATNIGGADKDINGNQSYSTYVEINYGGTAGDIEYNLFVGAAFLDQGNYYQITNSFSNLTDSKLINVGLSASKEIKITDSFSLPVNSSLIFNPEQDNVYLTFGFSL